ncbi:MAG: DUF6364 family protein [Bacteroidetes bacterium]|nr:DUF6364 family protein [Bacteroidota bacterium]
MNIKLTLTIEKDIIVKAKIAAKESGQSLSGMVENYLRSVTAADQNKSEGNYTPLVRSLIGSVRLPEGIDYKEALTSALREKYK